MAKRTAKKKKKRSARRKTAGRGRGAGTAKRTTTTRKAGGRGRGRPPALANVPMDKLEEEIARRQSQLDELYKQRERLAGELEDLDALIVAEGGTPGAAPARRGPGRPRGSGARRASTGRGRGGGSGRRARNDVSLVDALQQVLSGQQLSVSDAADAVKAMGYRSNAASFKTIVNQTLIKHPDKFKKVDRGVYTAA